MFYCQGVPSDMPNIDGSNIMLWMTVSQHMYDQIMKAHGFLNNALWDILLTHGANHTKRRSRQGGWWSEINGSLVGGVDEQNVEKPKKQRKRGPTIMFDMTRVQSEDVPAELKENIYTIVEDKRKLQQERRKKNKYNHQLSRKGYANLRKGLKNIPSEEGDLDRASMWKKACVDKKG
ncbi:hypothetical protein E5676_scaffold177G001260 [Cucumis melo var. makuwa]|uniref:Uncharacterized protein n=1 Tax=Cucumis melo var. makuwa TaxID=1194695 RepID=A0A5D3CL97_CUCMM|nr:hypothetical protein E5676_scaffold177G001260 [Cucumis melo var. makuwa]